MTKFVFILAALAACGDNLEPIADAGVIAVAPTEMVPDQCVGPDCATCSPPISCADEELAAFATCALEIGECVDLYCAPKTAGVYELKTVCR